MDTTELVIINWLDRQASALTTTQIHTQFSKSLSLKVVESALKSLLQKERVERVTEGFLEKWRSRKVTGKKESSA